MTVEELQVLISANTRELRRELNSVQGQLRNFGRETERQTSGVRNAFKKLGIGLIALGLGKIIKKQISTAMEAIESENLFDTVMGGWSKSVRAWSQELQKELGLNAYEVRKNVGVLFNMTQSMGLAKKEALAMSKQLTELSYDMASFYNIGADEAFNKLQAGITGEAEGLKRLGILVNETTIKQFAYKNGIAQVGAQLTEQQKVTARYLAIMEQTSNAQGDLARTISSPSNQLRILKTQLEVIRTNLGMAFMPIVQIVLPILRSLATHIAVVTSHFAMFMQALFGVEKSQNNIASSSKKISKNLGDVTKGAKKAGGALASFDEINNMSENNDSDMGISVPTIDTTEGGLAEGDKAVNVDFKTNIEEMKTKIEQNAEQVKKTVSTLKEFVTSHSDAIISAIAGIGTAFGAFKIISSWTPIITAIKTAFSGLATAIGAISLPILAIVAVIGALVAGVVYLWRTNEDFRNKVIEIWEKIKTVIIDVWEKTKTKSIETWGKIKEVVSEFWENTLKPLGIYLIDVFKGIISTISDVIIWLWQNILVPFGEFLLWFWESVLVPIGAVLIDVLAFAFGMVADVAKLLWDNVLAPLAEFCKSSFKPVVEALSAVFTFLWEKVLQPLGKFISAVFKVVFQALIKTLEFLWHKVLKPLTSFLWDNFKKNLEIVLGVVKSSIQGMQTAFHGILNFITGVFTGNWSKAWTGVKEIFSGVFQSLYGIVKVPLNLIIGAINEVLNGLSKIHLDVPDWVPGVGGKSFGVDIPNIPKLANGGITGVNQPFLAQVGDNKNQREVISPLGDLQNIIAGSVGTAVMNAMQISNSNYNSTGDVVLNIDGTTLARVMKPYISSEDNRIGNNMIIKTV